MSEFRVVRIIRSPADDRTFETAVEAAEAANALRDSETAPGVEYAIAHISYPVALDD